MTTKTFHRGLHGTSYMSSYNYTFPGPGTTSSTTEYVSVSNTDTFSGVDNPFHKAQIKAEVSATTPSSGTVTEVESWPILDAVVEAMHGSGPTYQTFFRSFIGYPTRWTPGIFTGTNVDTATLNQVTARVNSQFLEKAKSAISSFQSGQDIVELHQTIESIIHPLSSLRKHVETYFLNLKKIKGKYKSVRTLAGRNRSLAKALSDTYLEWTFGWNPLAADISQGIVDIGRTRFDATPVESFAKGTYFGQETDYVNTNLDHCFIVGHQKVTSEYSIRLKGQVNAYYNGTPPTLLQELQLLPEDFAPTVWNVLPYSFVIDYFLNIGDIIDAYSFPSAALRWCNRSTRDITKYEIALTQSRKLLDQSFPPALGYTVLQSGMSPASTRVSVKSFTRSAISALDLVPPLVIHIPPLSAKPWVNMAALIAGSKKLVVPYAFS